mgnify:CR=1 FL=1
MQTPHSFSSLVILIIGDIIVLGLTTLAGFAFHATMGDSRERLLITFATTLASWLFAGIPLGVYYAEYRESHRHLWRPLWASILAAPLATFLRGMLLERPILPIFVATFGGINALAILVWRAVYLLAYHLLRKANGRT